MDELVAWVTRVLDETERVARAAAGWHGSEWQCFDNGRDDRYGHHRFALMDDDGANTVAMDMGESGDEGTSCAHVALHDPRSVLARVEAERAVVKQYERAAEEHRWVAGEMAKPPRMRRIDADAADVVEREAETAVEELDGVIRLLAYGHRFDAAGYDPAWAPEGVSVDL